MIKKTNVAGIFYPSSGEELVDYFNSLDIKTTSFYKSKVIIVPHAGYVYSGKLAFTGFNYLKKSDTVFVIAPSHHSKINSFAVPNYSQFETPLGSVDVNTELIEEIKSNFECVCDNAPFEKEHSVEVQLPIIKYFFPDAKILPILTGEANNISEIIEKYYNEASFVISSDLSHFLAYKDAQKVDNYSANAIETLNTECFFPQQACGYDGVCGLIKFASSRNYSLIRIGMYNSGDITNDKSRVVGYGSWFLYEGTKNQYIKNHLSDFIKNVCKQSIYSKLFGINNEIVEDMPAVLNQTGASFVTLEIDNNLRGCIGSIIAHRELINDLRSNAVSAAFSDSRFPPLSKNEFDKISIKVSLLSEPQLIEFENEQDLLTKIYPNGLIIKDNAKQAVYLPVVWEQLPNPEDFLISLKIKAGMKPDYFSQNFEAYKFSADYIE